MLEMDGTRWKELLLILSASFTLDSLDSGIVYLEWNLKRTTECLKKHKNEDHLFIPQLKSTKGFHNELQLRTWAHNLSPKYKRVTSKSAIVYLNAHLSFSVSISLIPSLAPPAQQGGRIDMEALFLLRDFGKVLNITLVKMDLKVKKC